MWDLRVCRRCGCTDADACWPTCWWVTADLCSACEPTKGSDRMTELWRAFLDWLLGPRCPRCDVRVYPKPVDRAEHRKRGCRP